MAGKYDVVSITRIQRQWHRAEIIEAMRLWLEAGGSGKIQDWQGPPSSSLITTRVGWSNAVRAAGGMSRDQLPRSDFTTQEECIEALVNYLRDPATNGSFLGYTQWRTSEPSGKTIRNRFDTWSAAKRAAVERMQGNAQEAEEA